MTQLLAVLDNRIVLPPEETEQNLCADKGHIGNAAKTIIKAHGYIPHVKERGEEIKSKKEIPGYRARRWVVERTHSWLNRFRKLLVRFEKTIVGYEGLLELACALIAFRQVIVICG